MEEINKWHLSVLSTGAVWGIIYRFRTKSGNYKWVQSSCKLGAEGITVMTLDCPSPP